jgi:hypothetical protein
MSCITEPIKSSVIQWGLPIALLLLLTCEITYFLCKNYCLIKRINKRDRETNIILEGDCLRKLKDLSNESVDSIVTDPPYGLKFMGKSWDYDVPSVEIWKECFRVLKSGGHLLSFSGTRTYFF